ncbi:hypothetical protein A4X06_0g8580 [Tilletia controversa]|uniref:Extracellular membrane protein CFEM domain-containing protein n=2 Tax=Tilletia TaxID=13289 RepID=A0A8X7ST17_9BASI|nr:hypothetical protein CF328_g7754 [Tilletia controversa]KAE8192877.1 hypothetical protein CF336_g4241 [Tilletia laevis]KAE8238916.1 hypothetical protein A4X06_0g8580 [Tilletia controversa]KAE8255291.1 hypothetical protein A4X03_0g5586 [Tilletia caries]
MKSFTALMLIGMLTVIGTVKVKADPNHDLLRHCQAVANTCHNMDDYEDAWMSCLCQKWTKNGQADCVSACNKGGAKEQFSDGCEAACAQIFANQHKKNTCNPRPKGCRSPP